MFLALLKSSTTEEPLSAGGKGLQTSTQVHIWDQNSNHFLFLLKVITTFRGANSEWMQKID